MEEITAAQLAAELELNKQRIQRYAKGAGMGTVRREGKQLRNGTTFYTLAEAEQIRAHFQQEGERIAAANAQGAQEPAQPAGPSPEIDLLREMLDDLRQELKEKQNVIEAQQSTIDGLLQSLRIEQAETHGEAVKRLQSPGADAEGSAGADNPPEPAADDRSAGAPAEGAPEAAQQAAQPPERSAVLGVDRGRDAPTEPPGAAEKKGGLLSWLQKLLSR